MPKTLTVALTGNPNVGKTALFNNLTGARQHVANWPGVTVEKKEGKARLDDYDITVIDLPGTYSLSPYSLEEIIARNFIVDEKPDVVINVVDASNLERNLFLSAQIIDLGAKMVFALNMVDTAASRGIQIDQRRLAELWGVPVVPTVANRNQGTRELLEAAIRMAEERDPVFRHIHIDYGPDVEAVLNRIENVMAVDPSLADGHYPRWLATKLLEMDPDAMQRLERSSAAGAGHGPGGGGPPPVGEDLGGGRGGAGGGAALWLPGRHHPGGAEGGTGQTGGSLGTGG